MYKVLRYLLFILPAETLHYVALNALKFAHAIKLTYLLFPKPKNLPTKVFGLEFKNKPKKPPRNIIFYKLNLKISLIKNII